MRSFLCGHWVVGACVLGLGLIAPSPARGSDNNGFETDYFYTCAKNEKTKIHNEAVRSGDPEVGELGTLYLRSLTFSGIGDAPARLFGITPDGGWTDWYVVEVNSSGEVLKEVSLGTLAGQSLGDLGLTNIRYNPLGNSGAGSLVIPVANTSTTAPLKVYEVDLELSQILNVYTGPSVGDVLLGCDVDRATGDIYVATSTEVVLFDMGVTGSYTTVVPAASLGATPYGVIVRDALGGLTQQTLLVTQQDGVAKEFTLGGTFVKDHTGIDGTDVDMRYGQQDKINGDIYIASFGDNHFILNTNDTVDNWDYGWWGNYFDAASPHSAYSGPIAPRINEVIPDPDMAVPGVEYVEQLTLAAGTPPILWRLVKGPTGADVDSTGRVYGWTPAVNGPPVTFEVEAKNDAGLDTEIWQVMVTNNGFCKDWVYMVRSYESDGNIRVFWEDTGEIAVGDWTPPKGEPGATPWSSLTFSGTGDNDARLFVIKADPDYWSTPPSTDIMMGEMNASAGVVKTAKLGALAGLGANNLGANVLPHHIRYSAFHNSLFISVNPDKTTSTPLKVYEVNLSLSAVLNVYTGPAVLDDAIDVAIDPRNGLLYVVGANLNGTGGQGDLIAFDTSGGSTDIYTTLIDGAELADPRWNSPLGLAYRGKNNSAYRPTILVVMGAADPIMEYFLDQVDANGNLLERGEAMLIESGQSGQLDAVSGVVWLAGQADPTDMVGLLPDNTEWRPGFSSERVWLDAASPGGSPATPPPCNLDVFADTDDDGDVDQADFAVFQRCRSGLDGGIPDEPSYCKCFDRRGDSELAPNDGDIDQWDYAEFEACATGPHIPFNVQSPPPGCHP